MNDNGVGFQAIGKLDDFFVQWEETQRNQARDQRNAIAFFVKELVKEYQRAIADYIPRFDALRDEKLELQRKLEIAQREIAHLTAEIEQREFFGNYCNWLDTENRDNQIATDCGLKINRADYMLVGRYPRCPKCGRLRNVVVIGANGE